MNSGGEVPELAFTLARGQNRFFVELSEALMHELAELGVPSRLYVDELPLPRADLVHVFLPPHEYVALSGHRPSAQMLARSILVSAEQPDSPFFAANLELARDAGAVFDINPRAVRVYAAQEIEAEHLQLGYTRPWDRFDEQEGRDIDVLFLGRSTPRREAALASYADLLERFRCRIVLSDNARPNVLSGTTFTAGEEKRQLLARTKVLLNIHGEGEPYFEWLRAAEAICAGCAVVSERSSDFSPLRAGRHMLMGATESLGLLCAMLVEEDDRRERMRRDAYELLRGQHPLAHAARGLAEAATRIALRPLDRETVLEVRLARVGRPQAAFDADARPQPPSRAPGISNGEASVLRALKSQQLALAGVRRDLASMRHMLGHGGAAPEGTTIVLDSPAWREGNAAQLTVVTPLYNHRHAIIEALDSLIGSERTDWEALVIDDGSTDDGGGAVGEWIEAHPDRACRLVRHELNRGLAAARNTGIEHARSERLMMLDADNQVRPIAIGRLMEALDADPQASFAYGIMERYDEDGPLGLLSSMGWDPERLRSGNYIDAFAVIRRRALRELEGYTYDQRLYGWEDYDLWVRMAEAGHHGAFVPEIIGRYRVGHGSMISQTNVSVVDAFVALADHAPRLMEGLHIPH